MSPPGAESRLASLTLDEEDFSKLSKIASRPELPSTFQPENISQLVTAVPALFNMLNVRRAIIPGADGHCSARAVAHYYAALVDGGLVPPPHSSLSKPPLGTHPHILKFPSEITSKKQKGKKSKAADSASKKKGNGYELKMNHSKDFKDGGEVTVMGIPGLLMIALVAAAVMLVHPKDLQPVKTLAKIMPSGFLITQEFMMSSWAWVSTGI